MRDAPWREVWRHVYPQDAGQFRARYSREGVAYTVDPAWLAGLADMTDAEVGQLARALVSACETGEWDLRDRLISGVFARGLRIISEAQS